MKTFNKRLFKIALAGGLVGTVLFDAIEYFRQNKETSAQRQEQIIDTFRSIEGSAGIKNVEEGLEAIKREPAEIGYYLTTAELMEKQGDYIGARRVLESALSHSEEPSLLVCSKLQNYNSGNLYNRCPRITQ